MMPEPAFVSDTSWKNREKRLSSLCIFLFLYSFLFSDFNRYGEHASKLAENTVFAAGNIAMTAYNADSLGVKAIAKRAAKDTGKAVLQDLNEKKKGAGSAANGQVNGASYNGGGGSGHDNDENGYGNDKNGGKPPM